MPVTTPLLRPKLPDMLRAQLKGGRRCVLVYRTPGTSAEFSVRDSVLGIQRRDQIDYLCLAEGCELRLDWLVSVDGQLVEALEPHL